MINTRAEGSTMPRIIYCARYMLLFVVCMSLANASFAQTSKIPTAEDLRQMYSDGQYHATLQMISRLLFLKGDAAKNVDRPKLFLLRGDSLVRLGDARRAMTAFQDAEREASPQDPQTALQARASIVILENSRGLTYMPPGITPIDLKTNDGWIQAANAIYDSMWRSSQADLQAAQSAQDMGPIRKVVPTIANLVALDQLTGRDAGQLIPTVRNVGQRARDIITRFLNDQHATVQAVESRADTVLNVDIGTYAWGGGSWSPTVRRGLETPDRDALSAVIDNCNQAFDLALRGKEAAVLLGGEVGKWQIVVDDAAQIRDRAQRVMDAE
jgi:hypothetical protein